MGSDVYISGEDDAITEMKVRINDQSTISFAQNSNIGLNKARRSKRLSLP